MLTAHGLGYVRDGQQILAGIDVTVAPGESLAVTGPSGSGKTSLLAILSGLTAPTTGEVHIDGALLTGFAGPALGVSVVLQGYGLVSLLTAAENVEITLRAAGRPPHAAAHAARAALAQLGLEAHADHLIEELSGGQQQRTAGARHAPGKCLGCPRRRRRRRLTARGRRAGGRATAPGPGPPAASIAATPGPGRSARPGGSRRRRRRRWRFPASG